MIETVHEIAVDAAVAARFGSPALRIRRANLLRVANVHSARAPGAMRHSGQYPRHTPCIDFAVTDGAKVAKVHARSTGFELHGSRFANVAMHERDVEHPLPNFLRSHSRMKPSERRFQ